MDPAVEACMKTLEPGVVISGQILGIGYILSSHLFNLYAEYILWNARLDEAQAGIKIAGRNSNNFRNADDTTLRQKVKKN